MAQVKLNVSSLFEGTFSNIGPIFGPLVILSLPASALAVIGSWFLPEALLNLLNLAIVLVISPIVGGAGIHIVDRHLKNQSPDLAEAIQEAFNKAVDLILANLLFFLIFLAGLICLFIPGIYLGNRLGFILYAVMLQDKSATEALSASWRLTKGHWWGIFWCLLVGVIALLLLPIIVVVMISLGNPLILPLLSNGLGLLVGPILSVYIFMVYLALRQMSKGDDINRALS